MKRICKWLVVGAVVAGAVVVASAQRAGESTLPRHCDAVQAGMLEAQDKTAQPEAPVVATVSQSVWHKMDANKDGQVAVEEQRARQQEWLQELDADKDGKLMVDELGAQRMATMDADKDGVVTLEEYLVFFVGEEAAADTSVTCAKQDADCDRVITPAQVIAYRKSVYKTIDANGDGKVTSDEMQAHTARQFKACDTNKDGLVTLEELVVVFAAPAAAPAPAANKLEDTK